MTANVVHPAELERTLQARVEARPRTETQASRALLELGRPIPLADGLTVSGECFVDTRALADRVRLADGGSRSTSRLPTGPATTVGTTTDGAIVEYIGDQNTTFGSAGTGTVRHVPPDPGRSVRRGLQHGRANGVRYRQQPEVQPRDPAERDPDRAVRITRRIGDHPPGLCWELFADINDSNANDPAAAQIQLTDLEVWLTDDNEITGYDQTGGTGFDGDADLVYDFDGTILINDVNQGSGRGDLRYLIPLDELTRSRHRLSASSAAASCTTYFIVYTEWGDPEDGELQAATPDSRSGRSRPSTSPRRAA